MSTNRSENPANFPQECGAREWISGFLLLGILVGLLGSLLVAWQYHIDADPKLIGLHFLALSVGYVIAGASAQRLLPHIAMRTMAIASCCIGIASLGVLSVAVPPIPVAWRMLGLGLVGCAGGLLASSLLYILEPYFSRSPAVLANRVGALFGCGCLVSTIMIGATYFAGSVQIETGLLALAPLIFLIVFSTNKFPGARRCVEVREEENRIREMLRDLRSIAAVLFSVLLFFQFGNEWAIAGWLPLFLIRRLGANPVWAIFALAVYFLALLAGRLAVQPFLRRVNHRRLLLGSVFAAMAGYLLLSWTPGMVAAWIAVVIIGAGFAPIYPIVAETLDDRFSYHPGFYNGLFSIAITGAMFAPWLLGYVDSYLGMRYVMLLPAFGSIVVLVLALLIMLEAHLMGEKRGNHGDSQRALANRASAGK
ncbi:MAG TPA: MFS transporter [Bryobacteraceae bacterium]|nr:MFS transporter [Bryobacteraceae bacterium]